jgi:predicted GNAT family acetyltransferase
LQPVSTSCDRALARQINNKKEAAAMSNEVHDNQSASRFELDVDGHIAFAEYKLAPGIITFTHTVVPKELGGRGIGSILAKSVLGTARTHALKVVPQCEFIAGYIAKHPEFQDLLAAK